MPYNLERGRKAASEHKVEIATANQKAVGTVESEGAYNWCGTVGHTANCWREGVACVKGHGWGRHAPAAGYEPIWRALLKERTGGFQIGLPGSRAQSEMMDQHV